MAWDDTVFGLGDGAVLAWVRPGVMREAYDAAPVAGWWTEDLYCRNPREVRRVAGELIVRGEGFFFAVRPGEVFRDRPAEQRSYTDRDRLPRLART